MAAAPVLPLQRARPVGVTGVVRFHSDRYGRNGIFALDVASGIVSRVTTDSDHQYEDVAWSPDGVRMAAATTRFDSASYDLGIFDDTGAAVRVTTGRATERQPAWAPDGGSLLFMSDEGGTQAVHRVMLDTGAITRVSPLPDRALMPTVAPDGRRVAYTMGSADGLRVVLQDLASGTLQAVSPPGTDAAEPRWSPDGRRIAYARVSRSGSSIVVLTLETGVTRMFAVEGLATLREPSWSPDGRWIAAAATASLGAREDWDLVVLDVESSAVFRLTNGAGNDRAPAWRPR